MTGNETAKLINSLIVKSQELLEKHPINKERRISGKDAANSIWPWGGATAQTWKNYAICTKYKNGSVISAVDLIRGIGFYAGLKIIKVEGADRTCG